MPQNWKTYNLSEFININPKIQLKKGESYSFIEMKDLDANNKYALPSDFKELKGGARFRNGDTLFARITPCLENGKICQVKGLKDDLGFGSTEFLVFRGIEGVSDSNFIYYLSRSPYFRRFSESKMIGTSGRQRVTKDAYNFLELELPLLPEQKAIAAILSALDDKIELNLQMNKTLEEMAMTLYKHWFVDFGPFQNGKFVESELGMIPEGWEVKTIGNIAFNHKVNAKKEDILDDELYLGLEHISKGNWSITSFGSGEDVTSNKARFDPDDILFGKLRPYFKKIGIAPRSGVCSTDIIVCKPKEIKFYGVLLCSIYTDKFISYTTNVSSGTRMPRVNWKAMADWKIALPNDQNITSAFSEQILSFKDQILSNIEENKTLTKTRNTLLPKLISGEVRVKQAEEIINELT